MLKKKEEQSRSPAPETSNQEVERGQDIKTLATTLSEIRTAIFNEKN